MLTKESFVLGALEAYLHLGTKEQKYTGGELLKQIEEYKNAFKPQICCPR